MNVVRGGKADAPNARRRPEPRFIGAEGIADDVIRRDHHVGKREEQQFARGGRPPRMAAAAEDTRHLPSGPGNGRTYTSNPLPPPSVEAYAIHRPSGENAGTTLSAGLLRKTVGLPGVHPRTASSSIGRIIRIELADAALFHEGHELAGWMPRRAHLVLTAVGQPREVAGAVGVDPVQIGDTGFGTIGREQDTLAVGRPNRALSWLGSKVNCVSVSLAHS